MLDEFNADCPLTPKALENWLEKVIEEIEKGRTYVIDETAMNVFLNNGEGAVLTDKLPAETFNSIFAAIKRGDTLKCKTADGVYLVCAASYFEVTTDNYKSFDFEIVGTLKNLANNEKLKRLKIGIESLAGALRMHTRTTQNVTTADI